MPGVREEVSYTRYVDESGQFKAGPGQDLGMRVEVGP